MDKYIGKLLDNRYEILEVLGVGGMAVVYKARCRVLNRYVAIKIMKDEFANDEEFRRRFYNESQAVAKLSHNNIVAVYDVSPQREGVQYIVMELLDGITLKEYLSRKQRMSWQETLFFSEQICKALAHAHSCGIIHQDIKPHNIMLLRDGTVKVMDFGIAKFEQNQETRVIQEAIGSVHYISPEQAKGSRIDHRADLYSLGIVMYEMLTGRLPFDGDTPLAIVMKHINTVPPMPSSLVPGVPRGMDDIVMHAMCPVLEKRYASASQIYDDLERLKNNPNQRFGSEGASVRSSSQIDATMQVPRAARSGQGSAARRPQPQPVRSGAANGDQVYRPNRPQNQRPRPDDDDDFDERPRRKKFRLVESPAAMAGLAVVIFALIAVGVSVLMMSAGGGLSFQKETVPNLLGMTYEDAVAQYGSLFQIQEAAERVSDPNAEVGEIVEQDPAANTELKEGGVITVTVCGEKTEQTDEEFYEMEDFVGMDYNVVQSALLRQDLDLEIKIDQRNSEDVEKDKIIETVPAKGTKLYRGDTVTLVVSIADEGALTQMPTIVGYSYEEAQEILRGAKLEWNSPLWVSDSAESGTVIWQSVDPDEEIAVNSKIDFKVSTGMTNEPPETDTKPDEPEEPDEPVIEDGNGPDIETNGVCNVHVALPTPDEAETATVSIQLGGSEIASETFNTSQAREAVIPIYGPVGTATITVTVNNQSYQQSVTFRAQ